MNTYYVLVLCLIRLRLVELLVYSYMHTSHLLFVSQYAFIMDITVVKNTLV